MRSVSLLTALLASLAAPAAAQDGQEFQLDGFPGSRCFALGPKDGAEQPEKGWGLLVVMPGGPGTPDFLPWVENALFERGAPDDFVGVMMTAVRWNDDQKIVWPVAGSKVKGMEFTTEAYAAAVVAHASKRWQIDPERVHLLAWSSSGPATYQIALQKEQPFSGFFVAMSVFRPKRRASLPRAKGRRFFLYQSPDDKVTAMRQAERAQKDLAKNGAVVRLDRYAGGHGWHGDSVAAIESGLRWLDGDEPAPKDGAVAGAAGKVGANLLGNVGFEDGTKSWLVVNNSGRLSADKDRSEHKEGKYSLHLEKTGGMPMDLIRQDTGALPREGKLRVSAWVKAKGARNAFVKFFLYDENDEVLDSHVDLAHLRGDRDWQQVEHTYRLDEKARYGVFMVVMVLGGEVWVDGVEAAMVR